MSVCSHSPLSNLTVLKFYFYYRVKFDKLDKYLNSHVVKEQVYHIEVDLTDTRYLMYSEGHSLKRSFWFSEKIVGIAEENGYVEGVGEKARFATIKGFAQLDNETVIVADSSNYCLRMVDRATRATSAFAGTCTSCGHVDGPAFYAMFYLLHSLIIDATGNGLLVTEHSTNRLRHISLSTKLVSTALSSGLVNPTAMAYDLRKKNIFILNRHFISKYNIETKNCTIISGNMESGRGTPYGSSTTDVSSARYRYPFELIPLTDNLLLVSDQLNNWLRLIDVKNDMVYAICSGSKGTKSGSTEDCCLDGNAGILVANGTLYIGQYQGIRKIKSVLALNSV